MGQPTRDITSEMLITELERIEKQQAAHYPRLVEQEKMTPYERDHYVSCNKMMLSVMRQLHLLEKIHGMPYNEILKHIQVK